MNFLKISFFLYWIGLEVYAQTGQNLIGTVTDQNGNSVSYASISVNNSYGDLADSLGRFKIFVDSKCLVKFSSAGHQSRIIIGSDLIKNPIVKLDVKTINLQEIVVRPQSKKVTLLGYSFDKRIIKKQYLINSNFEDGLVFVNTGNIKGRIKSISIKAAFKGSFALPLRINIYNLDSNSLPFEELLTSSIIFTPGKKMKWYQFDLLEQNLNVPSNGLAISIELLNDSFHRYKLGPKFTPLIGTFESKIYKCAFRTDILNKWVFLGNNPPAIIIEIED